MDYREHFEVYYVAGCGQRRAPPVLRTGDGGGCDTLAVDPKTAGMGVGLVFLNASATAAQATSYALQDEVRKSMELARIWTHSRDYDVAVHREVKQGISGGAG